MRSVFQIEILIRRHPSKKRFNSVSFFDGIRGFYPAGLADLSELSTILSTLQNKP